MGPVGFEPTHPKERILEPKVRFELTIPKLVEWTSNALPLSYFGTVRRNSPTLPRALKVSYVLSLLHQDYPSLGIEPKPYDNNNFCLYLE